MTSISAFLSFILEGITWILIIEAVRRTAGPVFAIVVLLFSLHPLFALLMAILIGVGMIIGAMSLTATAHGISGTLTQLAEEHL